MAMTKHSTPRRPFDVTAALERFQAGNASFADLARAAEALDVPAWVLLIPGLALGGPEIERRARDIKEIVEDYLARECIAPAVKSLQEQIAISA